MKYWMSKSVALLLALLTMVSLFAGCGNQTQTIAPDTTVEASTVTVQVDGKQITVLDASGKTVQQILDEMEIILNPGDVLSVDTQQAADGDLVIQVLRKVTVKIAVEDSEQSYTVVLIGGTVGDALAAAGLTLGDDQQTNFQLDKALENNMQILISTKEQEETEGNNNTGNSGTTQPNQPNQPNQPTQPTTPAPTEPTTPQKVVVSVQYYDDCDGSGHGVKVITYSDGTQEEVPY